MTAETLSEAERMRRVPGIIFVDGETGRRARIAGTGIEVFEVAWVYRARQSWDGTREWFDRILTDEQLAAARAYYETFPDEIDARVDAMLRHERKHAGRGPWFPDPLSVSADNP